MMKFIKALCFVFLPLISFSQKNYKGAEIYSTESWKYGKIEIRMKMAKGSGILSTFFTYKNGSEVQGTFWEEIDIEVFGKNNAQTFQSNIITNNPKVTSEEVHSPGFSLGDAYHTYTLEWTPDYVAWYIDGVQMRKTVGGQVSDLTNPQSFRMNIWAAQWTDWVGTFDTQALPAYQFVNWIKYSSYTPGSGDNGSDFTQQWVDDFDTFDSSRWLKANWTFDGNLTDFSPENAVVQDGYLVLIISEADNTGFSGTVPPDNNVTGVKIKSAPSVNIYPNPASSRVLIQGSFSGSWSLQNSLGEVISEGTASVIDIEKFRSGVYYLNIENSVLKIVKK